MDGRRVVIWCPFPARAGVSRAQGRTGGRCRAFPRASGGLPLQTDAARDLTDLSPRERGSPGDGRPGGAEGEPFPARAGVSRCPRCPRCRLCPFPRASGGLPASITYPKSASGLSPRERGSPGHQPGTPGSRVPFPARAGVSRGVGASHRGGRPFPRASGGLPPAATRRIATACLSPRERGSPARAGRHPAAGLPFPARAGVSRWQPGTEAFRRPFPRASGGLPQTLNRGLLQGVLSPRERGSPEVVGRLPGEQDPFPARAGVSRACRRCRASGWPFPRASGGLPPAEMLAPFAPPLSPRERGSPGPRRCHKVIRQPFPARAGVSRSWRRVRARTVPFPRASGGLPHRVGSPV